MRTISSNRTEQTVIQTPRVITFEEGTAEVCFEHGSLTLEYRDKSASVTLYPEGTELDHLIIKLQSLRAWQQR